MAVGVPLLLILDSFEPCAPVLAMELMVPAGYGFFLAVDRYYRSRGALCLDWPVDSTAQAGLRAAISSISGMRCRRM